MSIGTNIAAARKAKHLSQEQLAEQLGVTFQTVSAWERDEYLPETRKLTPLAAVLNVSVDALLDETRHEWKMENPNFDPDHMYTYLKARAQSLGLVQTLKALPLMREKHEGQVRKGMVESTPYRVHPLTLACHALAMGIGDDDVLAALLLHDVVEDTDQRLEELPVNDRVKEAVQLVSYQYPLQWQIKNPLRPQRNGWMICQYPKISEFLTYMLSQFRPLCMHQNKPIRHWKRRLHCAMLHGTDSGQHRRKLLSFRFHRHYSIRFSVCHYPGSINLLV